MPEGWEQCVAVIATKKGDFEDPHLLYRNIKEHTIQEVRRCRSLRQTTRLGGNHRLRSEGPGVCFPPPLT